MRRALARQGARKSLADKVQSFKKRDSAAELRDANPFIEVNFPPCGGLPLRHDVEPHSAPQSSPVDGCVSLVASATGGEGRGSAAAAHCRRQGEARHVCQDGVRPPTYTV